MTPETEIYFSPESMEPLLPAAGQRQLAELACEILTASGALSGQVHSPLVREKIAALVREMNCYYSNLIEGHKTTPRDIERALNHRFSSSPKIRDNQKLSVAHIEVESQLTETLKTISPYSPDFLRWLHLAFYQGLPASLRVAETHGGRRFEIEPGAFRSYMVDVGGHTPPHFSVVPAFLDRYFRFYGSEKIPATSRLVALAAAHHRLAWLHPFGDGNGRVARLHTQALLIHHRLDGGGLWTLSRGLARSRQQYYDLLSNADQRRANDLDGRGNLSDQALRDFCLFFLETMLDQIKFMGGLLDLPALRTRIERYFQFDAVHLPRHRDELMRVVKVLADEGEISRTRVLELTGRSSATVAALIKQGLAEGFFTTPSPKGPLRIAFPEKILAAYFPRLFLDLPGGSA